MATETQGVESFIVLPHLEAVPPLVVAARARSMLEEDAKRGGPPDRRRALAERLSRIVDSAAAGGTVVLYDVLRGRAHVATAADAAALTRLRVQPEWAASLRAERPEDWDRYVAAGVVVSGEEAVTRHRYTSLEVEINRHCNYRCRFCPVALDPKPRAFIDDDIFRLALRRAVEYRHIREISLNHYSEPTLHPKLVDYIRAAAEHRLEVRLHTNASLLNEEKIAAIAASGNTHLTVNLPTVDAAEFEEQTGTSMLDRVCQNLERIHAHGIPVKLSINAPSGSRDAQVRKINERFAAMFGKSVAWLTDSRAGLIQDEAYARPVRLRGRLSGCQLAAFQMNVSYEGKAFLCCQDFNQEVVLGDIRHQTLAEIAEGEAARKVRRVLFGIDPVPPGHICGNCEWTKPIEEGAPFTVGAMRRHAPVRLSEIEIVEL